MSGSDAPAGRPWLSRGVGAFIAARRAVSRAGEGATYFREAVETWHYASEGPPLVRALAIAGIVAQGVRIFDEAIGFDGVLRAAGWRKLPMSRRMTETLVPLLDADAEAIGDVDDSHSEEEHPAALIWRDVDGTPVAAFSRHPYNAAWGGLYEAFPGAFGTVVQRIIWATGSIQRIETERIPNDYHGHDRPSLTPYALRDETPPVGADTVRVIEALRTATGVHVLIGPTGVGKTTIACHALAGKRVLISMGGLDNEDVVRLAQASRADVVILDDLEFDEHGFDVGAAHILDALAKSVPLVVVTMMADRLASMDALRPGSLYTAGMRPGRFDDIHVLLPPGAEDRATILTAHDCPVWALQDAVEQSEGLTGAYLRALAGRLRAMDTAGLGTDDWDSEQRVQDAVTHLRRGAPRSFTRVAGGDSEGHFDD